MLLKFIVFPSRIKTLYNGSVDIWTLMDFYLQFRTLLRLIFTSSSTIAAYF